jgi:hypothetical protein
MPASEEIRRISATKSGVMPRILFEPPELREPARPPTLPEVRPNDSATTGLFSVVSEGFDPSAIGDEDTTREVQS